jgi:hypothetical protein
MLLAGEAVAAPASSSARSAAATKTVEDPMITVTAHALAARHHASLGAAEAAQAEKAGHRGPAALAAHRAAAAEYRRAAEQHEAAARKLS